MQHNLFTFWLDGSFFGEGKIDVFNQFHQYTNLTASLLGPLSKTVSILTHLYPCTLLPTVKATIISFLDSAIDSLLK